MTSVDDERDEWQDDGDDEYEDVFVMDVIPDVAAKLEAANRLHEAATRFGDIQLAQERLDTFNRMQTAANDIERRMQQMQDIVDPPYLRWMRQIEAMESAFNLQRKVQSLADAIEPAWQRQMREHEAVFRRLNNLAPNGRWIRVRRPRRPEEPPPPTARKVEPEPEPRKTRGRPRKGTVERLAQVERLVQVVRDYRQAFHGVNPTKPVAADRLQLRSAATIDNWLRDELQTTWKPWLASLA